ncbi:MAG: hypothetical protein QOJ45_249 [Verrucomicrobiota bacterium]|jgi:hypothetical protein
MRGAGLFLLLVAIGVIEGCAKRSSSDGQEVLLQLSLANNQREFRIGETIPIKLSFSTRIKDHYQLNEAHYDRSGRMEFERFSITPAGGAIDLLPPCDYCMGGGLTNYRFLTSEPWAIELNINEWVRFTKPGEYKLKVLSQRVEVADSKSPSGTSPVTANSNEITLKILPVDRAWQERVYHEALAALKASAPPKSEEPERSTDPRRKALETLRFLGTAEATRELAKHMREDPGGLDFECFLGLVTSPEREIARSALEDALADPDHPIGETFLYALGVVNSDGAGRDVAPSEQQKVLEKLLRALPNKRGHALAVSLTTAVNDAWILKTLPKPTVDALVNQLVAIFGELPIAAQNKLLSDRWEDIASPALLPLLRQWAQDPRGFSERGKDRYESRRLTLNALKRWFDLDPASARPIVIQEITRPRPRFDAGEIGILPDETLPEVDKALGDHFTENDDLDAARNLASLIARYATAAILPQIIEKLDANVGTWACEIQNPILAYVLRINPQLARPRIEKAIAARGGGFSACNHRLFTALSAVHYDPMLEELGLHILDDPDPEVAADAATMLGRFGSPEAEPALSRRYQRWSKQWVGHESELSFTPVDAPDHRLNQLELGRHLLEALATGRNWLTDRTKLQSLSGLSSVRDIQQQLDRYLRSWDEQPLTISFDLPPPRFHASVAQYYLDSMEDLKNKLSQFPSGTKFAISTTQDDPAAGDERVSEIRTFLSSHAMSVTKEKPGR